MPNDLRLGIRLTADGKGFVGEVRVAEKELNRFTGATRRSATAKLGDGDGLYASTDAVAICAIRPSDWAGLCRRGGSLKKHGDTDEESV